MNVTDTEFGIYIFNNLSEVWTELAIDTCTLHSFVPTAIGEREREVVANGLLLFSGQFVIAEMSNSTKNSVTLMHGMPIAHT